MPRLRLLLALIALAGALLAAERALAQAQTQESEQDQAAQVVFAVPPAPMHDGLFRFLVPRFSLKTGVPVRVVALAPDGAPPADAGVVLAPAPGPAQSEATPLLADAAGQRYVLYVTAPRTHGGWPTGCCRRPGGAPWPSSALTVGRRISRWKRQLPGPADGATAAMPRAASGWPTRPAGAAM